MSQDGGPWRSGERTASKRRGLDRGLLIWIAVMAAGGVGLWLLLKAFPGALGSGRDKAWAAYYLVLIVAITSRLFSRGPVRWGEKARHAAIWVGIVAVLAVGFAYRGELQGVARRVQAEASGGYPVATGAREMVVAADQDGGFYVMGKVDGQPVRFLVDTGSSDTVLSPADARRVGVDVDSLSFDQTAETANGLGYGASVVVDRLSVGAVVVEHMPVVVNQAPMRQSLLGMSFLNRLAAYQVRDGKLYLTARE